ncbi:MAG: hypothetical protein GC190_12730 [Alphaproteobacteria bacterium]|nr:hypothetical protein [Alphaproteobacteria bacterium]
MMDQPSTLELVTAVKEFIEKHAMPQLTGHTAFHARVAANALGIVARELEFGPTASAEELGRLESLLGMKGSLEDLNRELCRRIRTGDIGMTTPGVGEHMRATTIDKVAIDQPTYSGFKAAAKKT